MRACAGRVVFEDDLRSVREEAQKLKSAGVPIVVALTNCGFERDKVIAESVPEVSVVVGGGSDSFLYNGESESKL